MQKYQPIMSLEVCHEYYSNKEFQNISIIPHSITGLFMKNHRVILKQKGNKIQLLQEGEIVDGKWSPTIAFEKPKVFLFQFKANDSLFQNKTEIEFHANKDKKFFINLNKFIGSHEIDVLPFYKGPFLIDNTLSKNEHEFLIASKNSSIRMSINLNPGETKFLNLDTPDEYTLYKDSERCYDFIWSNHDKQYDGYFSLIISPGIKEELNVLFPSRSLRWKYIVTSNYTEINDQLILKEESDRILFNFQDLTEKQAFFISREKIKLKDRYDYSFNLEMNNNLIMSNIGSPSTLSLNLNEVDVDKVEKNVDKIILVKYLHV